MLSETSAADLSPTDGPHTPADLARVLLVDDHDLFGQSLALMLEGDGFLVERAQALTTEVLVAQVERLQPDVVLLDLQLGDDNLDGVSLAPLLQRSGAAIVMVTGIDDPARLGECLAAGALSIVNKSEPYECLRRAVGAALDRVSTLSTERREELLSQMRARHAATDEPTAALDRLSPTEQVVLIALMEGRSAQTIAGERFVTVRTVRSQIEAILAKLGVGSQLEAVAMAWRCGWYRSSL